jgi:DNA-binding PadR family transcriptional regulator
MTTRAMHEATCLILAALADGSRHGYEIITDVQQISGGRARLRAGTLYAVLDRLRAEELVEVDGEEIAGSRLRRYYRLSRAGARRLPAEADPATAAPDLRIGDADRDAVVAALCEHFARGRLTAGELSARLDTALAATTQGEMSRATWDLP